MDRPFEKVYTVTDFYDGPRAGIADLDGAPHAYMSMYPSASESEENDNLYDLSPITPEVLALALEDWAIWLRWSQAYDAGITTLETHPALPQDSERHAQLMATLEKALAIDPERRREARGEFRAVRPLPESDSPDWSCAREVRWTLVP
ncbi:MAG: hypothetical protein JWO05_1038 [Gemmatimonadetes bacterium]|nr:hypothetical protein [Gemmatimonadota bacterium]